ncbi:SDR family oxidoreductase [Phenylobacterium sp. LjRoot219]|uniref:SDR family NAD(P)-dependent oxidoreductase n=1 Tax=Phenylobacterium sp. LjRoot219 TaxID=3342283 RepID=UPI003ECDA6DD
MAVVTGGASGIGRATVELFVAEGAKVVIADLDVVRGEELAGSLGENAVFQRTDVSKRAEVQALVDLAISRFGGLHVMFNNAGMGGKMYPHFLDDDLEDYERVLGVNLMGVVYGTQFAARHMAKHGGGVVINTASIAGLLPGYTLMQYRSSKSAVIGFSKAVAIDLAGHDIRVNVLAPGSIKTPMTDFAEPGMTADDVARIRVETDKVFMSYQPLKRQGRPEDAAQAVLFLASDRAMQVTGIVMPVDGGITAGDPINHAADIMAARTRVIEEIKRGR